jgi:hypothetical protein
MPVDPKVKTMFAALNSSFQSVQADAGLGSLGWWPEEGNHDCIITDVNMQDSTFKQKDGQTFPGVEIQFSYQLISDPGQDEPRRFLGAPIRLPVDMNALNDPGAKTRAEIELRRLKGHLTTCLRREPQDIGIALGELSNRLETSDAVIAVVVKCQYDTAKDGKQYRKEFLQKALSN